ncbi:peptidyl-prolyl cis-trans isomerase CYP59 [Arachis duranensis]|uniref:Peptidyl-prolyl cis-trans isomerase n=1 Tax=Arachis duranensis TaxID=130453 RepID=A0A6P4BZM6_ARADU|nr:peptidyl-prolyl cis-trans isomerase CYP59 [Arachis duranensis]
MSVLIVTSLGDIVVDLHTDKCPLTCKNFLKLCKIKYYNGCLFHTIQKDFTAQTGDPTGTGTGGDSIYKFLYGDQARFFGDEIRVDLKHSKTGTVAMASAGENLNASQFYITLRDDLDYLDGKHTVFGEVAEGFEALTRINEAYVDEKSRPYKNIRIKHTYILEDPYDDPPQLAEFIPEASPEGKPKDEVDDEVRLEDDWVPMDEQLNPAELEEVIREKEARSRAVVLESIGDIPDAEIKPPDNVLFVCKLNPVTEDEDLHTIFSRFGTVSSAEIIRDHKTGDSLCYAFIEFEDKMSCEQAYFKMDNALIDDRRIHVDFSQSVAKLWSQYRRNQKGKGGGCFKCGSADHIAKDCTADDSMKQPAKFVLKDNNTQHGGDNTRYEMVFDGDNSQNPKRDDRKSQRRDRDDIVENSMKDNFKDHIRRGRKDEMVGSNNRNRYSDRHRERGGDGDDKARAEKESRDSDYHSDRKDREKRKEINRDDDYRRKDEVDPRKRHLDDRYTERRASGDHRRESDVNRLEKRDDRDYRKRPEDSRRHDRKIDSRPRKRSPDEDYKHKREDEDYKRRREDEDYRHGREERGHRRLDTEPRDYSDRKHHGDRR